MPVNFGSKSAARDSAFRPVAPARPRVPVIPAGRAIPVSRGTVQKPVVAPRARVPELAAKQAAYNAWRAGKK
jgi:hypothetical protein